MGLVMDADESGSIMGEMAATERCGFMRFTYPEGKAHLIIEASMNKNFPGYVSVDKLQKEITGYNSDTYSESVSGWLQESELSLPGRGRRKHNCLRYSYKFW